MNSKSFEKRVPFTKGGKIAFERAWGIEKDQTTITYDVIRAKVFAFLLPAFVLHPYMYIISALVVR